MLDFECTDLFQRLFIEVWIVVYNLSSKVLAQNTSSYFLQQKRPILNRCKYNKLQEMINDSYHTNEETFKQTQPTKEEQKAHLVMCDQRFIKSTANQPTIGVNV